jgi:choline-glycine betaine transporter
MADIKLGRPTADLIELVAMLGGLVASLVMAALVLTDSLPWYGSSRSTGWVMIAPLLIVVAIGYSIAAIVRRVESRRWR